MTLVVRGGDLYSGTAKLPIRVSLEKPDRCTLFESSSWVSQINKYFEGFPRVCLKNNWSKGFLKGACERIKLKRLVAFEFNSEKPLFCLSASWLLGYVTASSIRGDLARGLGCLSLYFSHVWLKTRLHLSRFASTTFLKPPIFDQHSFPLRIEYKNPSTANVWYLYFLATRWVVECFLSSRVKGVIREKRNSDVIWTGKLPEQQQFLLKNERTLPYFVGWWSNFSTHGFWS